MSDPKRFYVTTTLPYVNAEPHVGYAMEIIRADILARYHKLMGNEVFFNTGTDEHGQKVYQKSVEANKDPQQYVDEYAVKFQELKPLLGLSEDLHFVRTTDRHHEVAAQEFWRRCNASGDIYKKNYKIKYCVGCELEKTESELVDGCCPIHPDKELEIIDEENYFFRFSKYQEPLLKFYGENPNFVVPNSRFNEIKKFVERGLEDFSISRLKAKMPWGVAVPDDDTQVMYVWFDALVNYISTLGWPEDKEGLYKKFWEEGMTVQYAGKDNLRQQTAMWQAMLMSARLPTTKQVVINGFINVAGQKMSKSLGNVVNPKDLVGEYGIDAMRYQVAREFSMFEDSDFTFEKFKEAYNANLANGLGNLVSRIMKMAEDHLDTVPEIPEKSIPQEFKDLMEQFEIQKAANLVWQWIARLDAKIQETEPFKLVKTDKEQAVQIIRELVVDLYTIGRMLNPLMPETNVRIKEIVKSNKKPTEPLFKRMD